MSVSAANGSSICVVLVVIIISGLLMMLVHILVCAFFILVAHLFGMPVRFHWETWRAEEKQSGFFQADQPSHFLWFFTAHNLIPWCLLGSLWSCTTVTTITITIPCYYIVTFPHDVTTQDGGFLCIVKERCIQVNCTVNRYFVRKKYIDSLQSRVITLSKYCNRHHQIKSLKAWRSPGRSFNVIKKGIGAIFLLIIIGSPMK